MKILVIGAGGTGGCIGGYLEKNGEDVTFIARGHHLEKMKEKGLQICSTRLGDVTIKPVKAFTMAEYNDVPDVVFVCVKYYGLEECIEFLKRVVSRDTMVIPILNIYGTGGKMQEHLPCSVLDGCVYIFSMIEEAGVIVQPTSIFRMFFGPRKDQEFTQKQMETLKTVEKKLVSAGIDAHVSECIERDALQKFSFVSPMGTAGLYYQAVAGDFMALGEKRDFFLALVDEVSKIGAAMDIDFEVDLCENAKKILESLTPEATTSMQRDVASGGASEVDGLVHEVVRLGEKYHVNVPYYRKVSLWAKERNIQ